MRVNKAAVIVSLVLVIVNCVYLFVKPIPQWPDYHCFADDRSWLGLENAQNVLSNIVLLLVGAWGVLFVTTRQGRLAAKKVWPHYFVFFMGVFLTAFGSAYYHYDPHNQSLVWDRLLMTIMFIGFITVVISELINHEAADTLLLPLLFTGFASVILWIQSEMAGAGDLRFYGLVQFVPVILVVVMLILYKRPPRFLGAMVGLLIFFGLAKLFEKYDHEVFRMLNQVVGGHAIKHVCAGISPGFLLWMLYRRVR
jgi:hypothetical membrane protein